MKNGAAFAADESGHTTRLDYDPLDEITTVTDPLLNQTKFEYDGNGNLKKVTDANQHITNYTYNNMDRVYTRQDPLQNRSSTFYDLNGNVHQFIDRKGQVTTVTYDGLNRPGLVQFNDGSSILYTFDGGNRLTSAIDSLNGTITRNYDPLDNLLSETTAQGSVGYSYDSDGRRQTMTVSGQPQISYMFDNASRLTSITQGSANVSFGYDADGRRTSLTLPNGVSAAYSYDAASQLTGIVYQGGMLGRADLAYGYDLGGWPTSELGCRVPHISKRCGIAHRITRKSQKPAGGPHPREAT